MKPSVPIRIRLLVLFLLATLPGLLLTSYYHHEHRQLALSLAEARGIPTALALVEVDRALAFHLPAMALTVALAFALAWWGGSLLLLSPVDALVRVAARLTAGDLQARTNLPHQNGELGSLAWALDELAAALEQRDAERRRAEQELRQSEERYRTLVLTSPDPIVLIGPGRTVLTANPQAAALVGSDGTQSRVARSLTGFIAPEAWPELEAAVSTLLQTGSMRNVTTTILRRDGSTVPVELSATLLKNPDGEPGAVVVLRDISERLRAQVALHESEQRFRSAFDSAPIGMALLAPDGHFLQANRALCAMLGYTDEDLRATSYEQLTHPDDAAACAERLRQLAAGRVEQIKAERRSVHKSGHVVWVLQSVSKVTDAQGQLQYFVAQMEDITQRRQAQEELREANERLTAILNAAPLAIVTMDQSGSIADWNPAAERIFGWSAQEVLGHPSPIEPDAERHQDRDLYRRVFQGQVLTNLEVRRQRRDGSLIDASLSTATLRDAAGNIRGAVALLSDITEHKRLEAHSIQAQRMESVGRLAGGVAHDFNNLLMAIGGYARFARQALPPDSAQAADLDQVLKAADRAANLTRQLLAFSRRQVIAPQTLDLNQVVLDLHKMLQRLIREDIELIMLPAPDLGFVQADPGQIEQVIINLVVNARDAMPEGGKLVIETANVTLGQGSIERHPDAPPGRYILLAVTDTGTGMTEEVQAHIFEPFFTTKEQGKGTGLGLATVYGIVKQHGGHISVYSEPGKGATFKIYLPHLEDVQAAQVARVDQVLPPRGSETLLTVEDDELVRSTLTRTLRELGYRVLEASNGSDALLLAEDHPGPIHLLLTDVVMPQMGGKQLSERFTNMHPETRVLFMSGYTDHGIVHGGILDQGIAFLQKPFTFEAVALRVREVLDGPGQ